ncbi:MAG: MBL fold metallo-hydrolase [Eubacteriales bacterium]|nr:MBL fold metallo-hydrolase [Eubacteriales bacterium]
MKFVSIGSGSSGNTTFLQYKKTNILIDCGLPIRRIEDGLNEYDCSIKNIDAILITHEHYDHIMSLSSILKKYDIKIFANKKTLKNIYNYYGENKKKFDPIVQDKILNNSNILHDDSMHKIKDITFFPFKTHHDVPSICYTFILGNKIKVGILTDTGFVDDYILQKLSGLNALLLESNYDENLLINSEKYPDFLKQRILSNKGHLANEDAAKIIMKINSSELKIVALGHTSKETNTYEIAYDTVRDFINNNYKEKIPLPKIIVAKRDEITEVI